MSLLLSAENHQVDPTIVEKARFGQEYCGITVAKKREYISKCICIFKGSEITSRGKGELCWHWHLGSSWNIHVMSSCPAWHQKTTRVLMRLFPHESEQKNTSYIQPSGPDGSYKFARITKSFQPFLLESADLNTQWSRWINCYFIPGHPVLLQDTAKSCTESGVRSPEMACFALRHKRFVRFLGMLFCRLGELDQDSQSVAKTFLLQTKVV